MTGRGHSQESDEREERAASLRVLLDRAAALRERQPPTADVAALAREARRELELRTSSW
jgi:hypothetical protein